MKTRLGILGFAHGHVATYCGEWAAMPDRVELVAGWDHDAERAKTHGERFKLDVSDSPAALLQRRDIDAVVIGAETSMHADLCEAGAAAGKAIVLQKPLALTLAQADRIVAAVNKHGVKFTLAWQMRVDPQNLRMKELLREGVLGQIVMVRRRHALPTHTWPGFANTWHVKPELNRGMWADDAAHPIDFLLWLLGEPQTVSAEIATLVNPAIPDDNGIAIFRYATGTLAEVVCSFTSVAGENTTEIVGTQGMLVQNYGDLPSASVPRAAGTGLRWYLHETRQWHDSGIASPEGQGKRIAALAEPLLDYLQGKTDAIATAEQGRVALSMVLASYRAAEQGRRVKIIE
jgi:predicted dehydrogenase